MRIVLDTNAVLDWLVFHDANMAQLRLALADGRVQIITHDPAVDELRRVLAYPQCKLQPVAQQDVLRHYQSQALNVALPEGFAVTNLLLPTGFPRCRDLDDEPFIALAYHARADALVTKDKDILRLRKRAARFGVTMLSPMQLGGALQAMACCPSRSVFAAPVRP